MWVIVYYTPKAAFAALRQLYEWADDTSFANPSTPASWRNARTRVSRPPRAAFHYLYDFKYDTSRSNPETPLSWRPVPIRRPRVPLTLYRLLYRPGASSSDANPSTPESWRNRQIQLERIPRLAFLNLYQNSEDTSQSESVAEGAPPWAARRLAHPFRPQPDLYFAGDTSVPGDEAVPAPDWRPRAMKQSYRMGQNRSILWVPASDAEGAGGGTEREWRRRQLWHRSAT